MGFALADRLRKSRIDLPLAGLILIILAGAVLRFYGLNWDDGHLFHPDERNILMVSHEIAWPSDLGQLFTPDSKLNPHSFAYGSLVFYLLKIVSTVVSWFGGLGGPLAGLSDLTSIEGMRLVGRVLSALFDLGTVILTFLLGRRLYGQLTGIVAAMFVSFSVLNIQLAHFYASDTLLTFFVMLAVLFTLRLTKENDRWSAMLVGLAIGLILATKVSGFPVVLSVVVAHLVRVFSANSSEGNETELRLRWPTSAETWGIVRSLFLTGFVAIVVFLICEPYALIDAKTFLSNINEQNQMVRGVLDYPYTRQYVDRPAFWYFIENLIIWGVGLPLGITMFVGLIWACTRSFFKPRPAELVVLAWVIPYFLITGGFHAKFLRYLLPIVPFLALLAAFLLVSLWLWLKRRRSEGQLGARLLLIARYALMAVVVLPTIFFAVAYTNVYSREHTAVSASKWIYQNIPNGAHIGAEHWEEGLPVSVVIDGKVNDGGNHDYTIESLNLYEDDNKAKLEDIVQKLQRVDYIVFFSQRLYGTIPRLPERYPMTTNYYEQLFSGQLGFKLDAYFSSYPNMAGLSIVDDTLSDTSLPEPAGLNRYGATPWALNLGRADESFSVYDHPLVLIFKKEQSLSANEFRQILQPTAWPSGTQSDEQANGNDYRVVKAALLSASDQKDMVAGGTFSLMFQTQTIENQWPLTIWVLLLIVLGLVTLPGAMMILGRLPDGGYGLIRTLSILSLGWITWIVVSLRLLPNIRSTIIFVLVLLVLINAFVFIKNRKKITRLLREKRRVVIFQEVAFWAAFVLFLSIRMANPDLWHPALGGEKPMDIAYLMAVMKSEWFPPYDPWFAGGYLNYYYFGQVLVGTLIKLTGIVPTTAYNLVIPLLFALTFSGACSCSYNLTMLVIRTSMKFGRLVKVSNSAIVTGLLGGIMAVMAGNLGGAGQLGSSLVELGDVHLGGIPGLDYVLSLFGGLWRIVSGSGSITIPSDWYWTSTRVIDGTINEFPFFSFLYADLHAHLIALPVTMLVLGLALAWLTLLPTKNPRHMGDVTSLPDGRVNNAFGQDVREPDHSTSVPRRMRQIWDQRRRGALPLMGVTSLAVGSLAATNFWDYPTYLVIIAGVLFFSWYQHQARSWSGLLRHVLVFVSIAVVSYILFLPFHFNYQSYYFGIESFPDKSNLGAYLTIHGLLLFAVLSLIVTVLIRRSKFGTSGRVVRLALANWKRLPTLNRRLARWLPGLHDWYINIILVSICLIILLISIGVIGLAVVAVLVPLLVVAAVLALQPRRPAVDSVLFGLIALGAALGIACEFVAVKGDVGRMNTVFRFYLQTWMIWSIVGSVGLYRAYKVLAKVRREILRYGWMIVCACLLLACLVYPIVATSARVSNRFETAIRPTLDGTAYMGRAIYQDQGRQLVLFRDLEAIRWLQENVQGSPVVLEGRAPLYHWGSRISVYTGLPTVLGWDWHQKQQRVSYAGLIDVRARDVTELYSSIDSDHKRSLLAKYQIRYVYVGELEQAYYPANGLAKFDTMVGDDLKLVYERYGVKIYEVAAAVSS